MPSTGDLPNDNPKLLIPSRARCARVLRSLRLRWTIVVLLAACSREPKPHLTVEPERLDLGRMSPGDSYQGRLRLLSNGDAPLLIDMIVASNQRISIDALQGIELPPGGSMEARVGFDAIEPGAIDAHVTI